MWEQTSEEVTSSGRKGTSRGRAALQKARSHCPSFPIVITWLVFVHSAKLPDHLRPTVWSRQLGVVAKEREAQKMVLYPSCRGNEQIGASRRACCVETLRRALSV